MIPAQPYPFFVVGGPMTLDEVKRLYVARVLEMTGGKVGEAALILGITRQTLWEWGRGSKDPILDICRQREQASGCES